MNGRSLGWLVAAMTGALAGGCGSTVVTDSSGAGGGGSGGGSGGTTTTTVSPECAVASDAPGPHAIAFHFSNPTKQLLYLRQDCELSYSISSCEDGYTQSLGLSGACSADCADPETGCIVCGPCPEMGILVSPGTAQDNGWSGQTFTFGMTAEGCTCHDDHVAPNGKYRVRIPVYLSEQEAISGGMPAWVAEADFELPAGGDLTVPLTQP